MSTYQLAMMMVFPRLIDRCRQLFICQTKSDASCMCTSNNNSDNNNRNVQSYWHTD